MGKSSATRDLRAVSVALLALITGFVLTAAPPAQAVIMGANVAGLGASDDGFNVTQDTGTGLEWLDLTLTVGANYNEVVAGAYYTQHGFTHASLAQVAQLFANANLVRPDNSPISSISMNLANPTSLSDEGFSQAQFYTLFDSVELLSILLGDTTAPTGGASGDSFGVTADLASAMNRHVAGISAAYSPFSGSSSNCWGTNSATCDSLRHSLAINLQQTTQGDNSGGGTVGHFLVRAIPTGSTGIPEPGTLALLGFGLAGVAFARRRKRAG